MTTQTWQPTRLKSITTKIGSGATPRGGKEAYKSNGITLIRSLNVYDFHFDYAGLAHIDDAQAQELANVEVQHNDILLNITGASVARCCMVPDDVLPARVNQHVAIIRVDPKAANPHFVFYSINSPQYKQHLLTLSQGGATREALTKFTIENFEIALPSLSVQDRVVEILLAYDGLIENNTRRINLLEQAVHDLYQEWFVRLNFPDQDASKTISSALGDIPEGWKVVRVSDVVEINPRIPLDRTVSKPFLAMERLSETSMVIDTSNLEYRTGNSGAKFQNNDTLLARITPSIENGKTGFVYFLPNGAAGFGSTEFIVMRSKTLSPEYVYCLARNSEFRNAAIKTMTGASGRQRVQNSFFNSHLIVQPSEDIIRRFSVLTRPIFKQVNVLAQKNQVLRQTRDILLPRLISGEFSVDDIEISVAQEEIAYGS